jgi:hypothetical protein
MMLQHLIVFFICIVFPGLTTGMAPATWLTFERNDDGVRCTTRTCVFFVVPFRTQRVEHVTKIEHRERTGRTERQRSLGRTTDKTVHVDGEGFLQIHGLDNEFAEVSVSPASIKTVAAKATEFLNASSPNATTIFAIANWKFGAIMGGVLSLFTLLYVVGYSLEFLKFLLMTFKKIVLPRNGPPSA